MLEFIFFNRLPCDQFDQFVNSKQVVTKLSDTREGYLVSFAEETDDDLVEEIEAFYDEMLDLDRDLFEQEEEQKSESVTAGVALNLSSGIQIQAKIPVATLNKILSVMDTHELADFVNAIVDAVENPSQESICCRKLRDSQTSLDE